jgi:hypothetical protein
MNDNEKLKTFLKGLEESAMANRTKSPQAKQSIEDLPLLKDVIRQLVKPGTILEHPNTKVINFDTPQSPVKQLSVKFMSTMDLGFSLLHKIHMEIRGKKIEKQNGNPSIDI